ncbi:MAG: arylsulfatase [bacterium]|nr:arylsulfatase [bacterium]
MRLLACLITTPLLAPLLAPLLWAQETPPNVILILADDLGWGDLGCYGQEKIRTPHIDRMAAEGMRFTQFYAGSTVCAPSRCVLMTGKHLGHAWIRGNARQNLRPADWTVAEAFHAKGYTTGLVGKWGIGHEGTDGMPTRQGFDHFFGYLDQAHAHNYYPSFLIRGEERVPLANVVPKEGKRGQGVATEKSVYAPDLLHADALRFVRESAERPFFLYLAYTIPHANNEAGKRGMEIPDHGAYAELDWPEPQKGHAAMISRMDREIGEILALLTELEMDERTLVLFTSDNGPHREGGNDPDFADSNGPLRGIKRTLYEGGIRVPLVARWPGRIEGGSVSDHVGYFGDMLATACELTGTETPDGLDSKSLLPTLLGDASEQEQHDYLYWEFYERGNARAVRAGKWKAVMKPMTGGTLELFDLDRDAGEKTNVAEREPEVVEAMRAILESAHVPNERWKLPEPKKR